MQTTNRLFTLFLAFQGISFLALAINNSVMPLGGFISWALLLLLFSSPVLGVLSVSMLLKESRFWYRIASVIGLLTAVLGIALIVSLFIAFYRFT